MLKQAEGRLYQALVKRKDAHYSQSMLVRVGIRSTCDSLQLCNSKTPGSLVACHNEVFLGDSCMVQSMLNLRNHLDMCLQ